MYRQPTIGHHLPAGRQTGRLGVVKPSRRKESRQFGPYRLPPGPGGFWPGPVQLGQYETTFTEGASPEGMSKVENIIARVLAAAQAAFPGESAKIREYVLTEAQKMGLAPTPFGFVRQKAVETMQQPLTWIILAGGAVLLVWTMQRR